MTAERIPSGIPGLNEILDGGFVAGRSYLLVGAAGTGKTTFAIQWLLDGHRRGEQGLYISLAEPTGEIERNVANMGWDVTGLRVVDLAPADSSDEVLQSDYQVFPPSDVEHDSIWQAIYRVVRDHSVPRLVIDSITQLRFLATDEFQFRKHILSLVSFLNRQSITALLMFEPTELERDTSVALAVDGILRLRRQVSPGLGVALRSIEIEKLRGSDFMSGLHPLRISASGLRIFPHRMEEIGEPMPGESFAISGVPELDQLLGGGLESGTTTLITGPTGAGKSVLGTQFLTHFAAQSAGCHHAALFTFEEARSYITIRSANIGYPINALLESGALTVTRVNAAELYPDEFLGMVRAAVEQNGVRMVMIDSLRGYELAMAEFGTPQAHIHNLVVYLNRMGVTTLLINEVENITGTNVRATDLGVSHLADNIVLMRYAEHGGQLVRVISCLKKRLGGFQPELREFSITANGLHVGEKLAHLSGVLTGLPVIAPSLPANQGPP